MRNNGRSVQRSLVDIFPSEVNLGEGSHSWRFESIVRLPDSSGRKAIYGGTVHFDDDDNPHPAIAKLYQEYDAEQFVRECSMCYEQARLGVGPSFFFRTSYTHSTGIVKQRLFCLVEEDLGASIEDLLTGNGAEPQTEPFSRQCNSELVKRKILFDVYSEVLNLHSEFFFHRDLRIANLCVAWHGDKSMAQNIRASLVDYELSVENGRVTDLPARAERYIHVLFPEMRVRLARSDESRTVTAQVLDLGYLAALKYEIEHECLICSTLDEPDGHPKTVVVYPDHEYANLDERDKSKAAKLSDLSTDYYSISEDGIVSIRPLSLQLDIRPLAEDLGMIDVDAKADWPSSLKRLVQQKMRHSGYLDTRDVKMLEADPEYILELRINDLDRGFPESKSIPESHRNHIRSNLEAVKLAGYRIVVDAQKANPSAIDSFTESEIELLAINEHYRWRAEREADGWHYADERNDRQKHNPLIVDWDELDESVQERNRSYYRNLPDNLRKIGLSIVRQ